MRRGFKPKDVVGKRGRLVLYVEGQRPVVKPSAKQVASALMGMGLNISGPSTVRLECVDGSYVQVAGASAKLTVELHTAKGAHYIIGRETANVGLKYTSFTGGLIALHRSELFPARIAVELFESFVLSGDLPAELARRDITLFGLAFEKLADEELVRRERVLLFASVIDPDAPLDATLLTRLAHVPDSDAPPMRSDIIEVGEGQLARLFMSSLPPEHLLELQTDVVVRRRSRRRFCDYSTRLDTRALVEALLSARSVDVDESNVEVFMTFCRRWVPEVLEWEATNVEEVHYIEGIAVRRTYRGFVPPVEPPA